MSFKTYPGLGAYRAGENCLVHHPRSGGEHYGALVCHGATGDYQAMLTDPFLKALSNNLGLTAMTADFGGASPWFNATHRDGIQSGFAYLTGMGTVRDDKVILIGASMGFAGVMRWARENPTKVLAIVGIVGVADADAMYNSNRGGLAAAMDAAWGGSYLTNGSPESPLAKVAQSPAVPHLLCHSTGDVTVLSSEVAALATALGSKAQTYSIPGAPIHGSASGLLPPTKILDFLAGVLG